MAHIVIGALSEAAVLIASADDPAVARAEAEPAVLAISRGCGPNPRPATGLCRDGAAQLDRS